MVKHTQIYLLAFRADTSDIKVMIIQTKACFRKHRL